MADSVFGQWHDDEEEHDYKTLNSSKEGIVFVVDCRSNMFAQQEESSVTPFSLAMTVIARVMKQKIIAGGKNLIGVIFFGSKVTKNRNSFEEVYEFVELGEPSPQKIRDIESFKDDPQPFLNLVGSMKDETQVAPLEYALWLANFAFSNAKLKADDNQQIWLFSNDDNPLHGDAQAETKAITRANDLTSAAKKMYLWPLTDATNFDLDKVYARIVPDKESVVWFSSHGELDDLIQQVRRKEFAKRRLSSFSMVFGEMEIGVELYCMLSVAAKSLPLQLDRRSLDQLKTETRWLCERVGAHLTPDQIMTYQPFGANGKKVFVTKDEVAKIKQLCPVGMELLGFKDVSCIKPYHSIRSPYFLRPDEAAMKGSTCALVAILLAMTEASKVAIVRLSARSGSVPKLAALIPQTEEKTENDEVIQPAGFQVVILPWGNEIRDLSFDYERQDPERESVDAAKALMKRLLFEDDGAFDPHNFSNPIIQKHWASLEALALEKDELDWNEEEDDDLQLAEEQVLELCANELQAFLDSYGGEDDPILATAKRKSSPKKASAPKKPKADTADIDWKEYCTSGKISKLTVAVLKDYCSSNGLSTAGRKSDLLERVKEHVG